MYNTEMLAKLNPDTLVVIDMAAKRITRSIEILSGAKLTDEEMAFADVFGGDPDQIKTTITDAIELMARKIGA